MPEEDDRDVDQQPVGKRIGDLPELRLDVPAPGEEAVDLVGDRGRGEEDRGSPAAPVDRREDQHRVDRDHDETGDGQRVRELRQRP